jgi:hypothetical protein
MSNPESGDVNNRFWPSIFNLVIHDLRTNRNLHISSRFDVGITLQKKSQHLMFNITFFDA